MLWNWANSATRVFILDLDGTLIPSAEMDNECFWQAVSARLGSRCGLPVLQDFKHVTDSGILEEWCIRELGRPPRTQETEDIKQHFVQLLSSAFDRRPGFFEPLPGVVDWLESVRNSDHVLAGIATGGWEISARLKLKLSGLDRFVLPMASSDDAVSRTDIMQIAAQRTLGHQTDSNADFTYVGDGEWDVRASRELDWKFVGIAQGVHAKRLEQAGAKSILANFIKP